MAGPDLSETPLWFQKMQKEKEEEERKTFEEEREKQKKRFLFSDELFIQKLDNYFKVRSWLDNAHRSDKFAGCEEVGWGLSIGGVGRRRDEGGKRKRKM